MVKKKKVIKKKVIKKESNNKMPDHIDEYFAKVEGSKEAFQSRELFQADEKSIDLKTDLTNEEIGYVNVLMFNDFLLKKRGLEPLFNKFIYRFLRLKVSKDRQSRGEFVHINKADKTEDALNMASNLSNITGVRK